jgi:hypothetical protein
MVTRILIVLGVLFLMLSAFLVFFYIVGMGADKHHVSGAEWATADRLRAGILAAEVRFQESHYCDEGHPGIGEYGFLSECSAKGLVLTILDQPDPNLSATRPMESGYGFAVYLPDGPNAGVGDPYPLPRHVSATAAALRERFWVAYAWPLDAMQGKRVLAIDQSGNVWVRPATGFTAPPWNALYGAAGWGGHPTDDWEPPPTAPIVHAPAAIPPWFRRDRRCVPCACAPGPSSAGANAG